VNLLCLLHAVLCCAVLQLLDWSDQYGGICRCGAQATGCVLMREWRVCCITGLLRLACLHASIKITELQVRVMSPISCQCVSPCHKHVDTAVQPGHDWRAPSKSSRCPKVMPVTKVGCDCAPVCPCVSLQAQVPVE
jgi:hypothetical protein